MKSNIDIMKGEIKNIKNIVNAQLEFLEMKMQYIFKMNYSWDGLKGRLDTKEKKKIGEFEDTITENMQNEAQGEQKGKKHRAQWCMRKWERSQNTYNWKLQKERRVMIIFKLWLKITLNLI